MTNNIHKNNSSVLKRSLHIASNIIFCIAALFITIIIIQNITTKINKNYIPSIFGHTYLNVLSGSMEPNFNAYDLIIGNKVTDVSTLKPGDIITFKDGNMLVTHRIKTINDDGSFITKGDANNIEDSKSVAPDMIVSKLAVVIPKAGYLISKLQNPIFLLILWILIMWIIISAIIKEFKKISVRS